MNIQRLRNITTGRLHTEMSHIYEDIEYLVNETSIMTHMLPNAYKAIRPLLQARNMDTRLWDNTYDTTHVGDIEVPPFNEAEQAAFWEVFNAQPDLLQDKPVKVIRV
jgi:hypothetical protein